MKNILLWTFVYRFSKKYAVCGTWKPWSTILLHGAPGTGKTLLVSYAINEARKAGIMWNTLVVKPMDVLRKVFQDNVSLH